MNKHQWSDEEIEIQIEMHQWDTGDMYCLTPSDVYELVTSIRDDLQRQLDRRTKTARRLLEVNAELRAELSDADGMHRYQQQRIAELERENERLRAQEREWIPVSQLPEMEREGISRDIIEIRCHGWCEDDGLYMCLTGTATHWRPLPNLGVRLVRPLLALDHQATQNGGSDE